MDLKLKLLQEKTGTSVTGSNHQTLTLLHFFWLHYDGKNGIDTEREMALTKSRYYDHRINNQNPNGLKLPNTFLLLNSI